MQTLVRIAVVASAITLSGAWAGAQSPSPWPDDFASPAARLLRRDPFGLETVRARTPRDEGEEPRPPTFNIELTFGGGDFEHETEGSALDGKTDAGLFRFRFEGFSRGGFGGGLELEGIATEDDLFAASGFGATEGSSGELFGYFGYRVWSGRFTMPIRFGLFVRNYTIDQTAASEVDYTSAGVKVAVEPDIAFVQTRRVRFSAFGQLAVGVGATEVETSPATSTWDTSTATLALDLGLRVKMHVVTLALAYQHRAESIDESDVNGGTFVRAVDTEFNGLGLTLGFVF